MYTHRPRTTRRLTAREAEQLLTGQPVAPDRRALARLLAAAAAPARPGELAGERLAVEAYSRAYHQPVGAGRRGGLARAVRRTALVKATVGATVLLVGGAALAAETGRLPAPAQQSAHDLLYPFGVPAPRQEPPAGQVEQPPNHRMPVPATSPSGAVASVAPHAVTPSADVATLCRSYLGALARHEPVDPEVHQKLVALAGGPKKIVGYCGRLLAATPTPLPTPTPTNVENGNGKGKDKKKGGSPGLH
ncbi:MAG: hypothetical protein AUI14_00490 [Actinobacteria bacterium 13_2_20CM_2_71_6]|nr:MAG: hypothetical protein AUI14_00490 [Actinobacteria bacterium 13_2_20CM_2_71_6]